MRNPANVGTFNALYGGHASIAPVAAAVMAIAGTTHGLKRNREPNPARVCKRCKNETLIRKPKCGKRPAGVRCHSCGYTEDRP